jgi:hypothetical protein
MLIPFQTDKAVYFVVTTSKDGRVSTTLERKIPIVTIRSVALTNLQDDFVVRAPPLTVGEADKAGSKCQPMRRRRSNLHLQFQD